MWSRRDQIQAYQFLRRRTVSAALTGDANHAQSPTRRTVLGLVIGAVALVLALSGFCVYGFLRPGTSTAWRTSGAIIQEKESGARFVLGSDNAVHPVLNYASARLATGSSGALTRVSARSLAAAGRGLPIGIPGAPDSLPQPARLIRDPWLACSTRPATAGPADAPALTVVLGPQARNGRVVLGPGTAVVSRSGGQTYVVTGSRRFRVRAKAPDTVLDALGLGRAPRIPVDARWLTTIPAGPDLGYLTIRALGRPVAGLAVADARVGQVFREQVAGSGAGQYWLLLTDGLAPISATQARLTLADPRSAKAYGTQAPTERALPPLALATAPRSVTDLDADQFPAQPPQALTFPTGDDVVLCSSPRGYTEGLPSVAVTLAFASPVPAGSTVLSFPDAEQDATPAAVFVPAGTGALVRSVPLQGVTTGPVFLVTDEGRRYPVPDADARKALGFDGVRPLQVAAEFVDLLPVGPVLDREAAALVVSTGTAR